MRIGILGGTFDPPHIGHLVIADQACAQLRLDRVWFAPAGDPPHKGDHVTPIEHRVAMLELAIRDNPCFELCRVDVERPGPHYSFELVEILDARYPGCTWHFIIGADSFMEMPRWRNPERLIALARLAVAKRPGTLIDAGTVERALPGITQRIDWVDTPLIDISSTDLRRRARAGWSLRYVMPEAVAAYIERTSLYR